MCVMDLGQCNCSCHSSVLGVRHVAPCCGGCSYCFQDRIPLHMVASHQESCYANPKNRQTIETPKIDDGQPML